MSHQCTNESPACFLCISLHKRRKVEYSLLCLCQGMCFPHSVIHTIRSFGHLSHLICDITYWFVDTFRKAVFSKFNCCFGRRWNLYQLYRLVDFLINRVHVLIKVIWLCGRGYIQIFYTVAIRKSFEGFVTCLMLPFCRVWLSSCLYHYYDEKHKNNRPWPSAQIIRFYVTFCKGVSLLKEWLFLLVSEKKRDSFCWFHELSTERSIIPDVGGLLTRSASGDKSIDVSKCIFMVSSICTRSNDEGFSP